jgi:ABC-type multidrug transport system fused ATPase/permease subunit
MISGPEFWLRYREDEVTRQQVRPGTVRRVWPYLRRYRGPMVLLVFITAVGSASVVVSPLILRLIIDDGILRHRESVVVTLALVVAALGLMGAGAEYVKSWYSAWIGESLVLELRVNVFRAFDTSPGGGSGSLDEHREGIANHDPPEGTRPAFRDDPPRRDPDGVGSPSARSLGSRMR